MIEDLSLLNGVPNSIGTDVPGARVAHVPDPSLTELIALLTRGPEVNMGGRAPLLRMLRSIAGSNSPYLFIEDACEDWPGDAAVIRTFWNMGMLNSYLAEIADPEVISFDQRLGLLHVRSEPLHVALARTDWEEMERSLPHLNLSQDFLYDVAISFATEDRPYVEELFANLVRLGHPAFYDFNEQDRLLGSDCDAYLERAFLQQSRFVVVVPTDHYGKRRSHCYEVDLFQEKLPRDRLLPIFDKSRPCGPFDTLFHQGHLWLEPDQETAPQAAHHARVISKKIGLETAAELRRRRG
ncbi:TIR domain-containing protein [Streptomyces tendae]|uniref:TIR domain-containing protein n=1 Tax=Streptomyces tendae TaxID=1932 RepID=UPI003691D1F0